MQIGWGDFVDWTTSNAKSNTAHFFGSRATAISKLGQYQKYSVDSEKVFL